MIDHDRPPVVIEDIDRDPLEWLTWIVDHYPHVTEEGQVVLIDGSLLARLFDGKPEPDDATLAWSVWVTVRCDRITANDPDLPAVLVAVTPEGRVPFEPSIPACPRFAESRTFWLGPSVKQLVEELTVCA